MKRNSFLIVLIHLCSLLFITSVYEAMSQTGSSVNSSTFGAMEARHIGPATMSGRITAIDAIIEDPNIIYVGTASGGLWKTKNQGVIFKPIFDDYCQSIGAVAIDQKNPDIVWVGTGETNMRNSVSIGNGIYKSTNAGESWKKMGLESTERIARIIIHPKNSDIVYVAVPGPLWNSSPQRGIFTTKDGGKSWEKILYIDENTGCADLAIDPENPDILYAGMWEFRRKPYFFNSGGNGSGLFKSIDGGKSWVKLEKDLPKRPLGRISVAISPVNPNIVYALIEAEKSALYRSEDKGNSWITANTTALMGERPFYFSNIVADPVDTNRIYKPAYNLLVSNDKGDKFRTVFVEGGQVHVDHHALWISKKDNNLLYLGSDGGVYISHDKGSSFRILRNLPVSQFYHASADMANPYNVYGGLQDNGSWVGPSKSPGGITNSNWQNVGGGDGFYVLPDPKNDNIVYLQTQGGNVMRRYKNSGEVKEIKPYPDASTKPLRFHWDTPVAFGPASNALYIGSQYLYKSADRGDTWIRISPDLTTNDPAKQRQSETGGITLDNTTAENHCTIYSISESPLDQNIIWVGTDDGNLQLSTNGGKTWTNVIKNIAGLPPFTWCSSVSASNFEKGRAYATFDGHRTGNMKPYVYMTNDFGKTWTNLADENISGYCHIIKEDLVNPELLFIGTELGLFLSIDGGKVWSKFTGNLPNVSVMDMFIHPREHDLILATHGRGIMIIDDITPLRKLTNKVLEKEIEFLDTKPYIIGAMPGIQSFPGDDEFVGRNPIDAVTISYYMKRRHIFGDMYLEILDNEGNVVQNLPAGKRRGINIVQWLPRKKAPRVPPATTLAFGAIFGPNYPAGEYKVRIVRNEETYLGSVKLLYDPNSPHSINDREVQHKTLMQAYNMLEQLTFIIKQLEEAKKSCNDLASEKDINKQLQKELTSLGNKLDGIRKNLVATRPGSHTGEVQMREKISNLYGAVSRYQGHPTQSQIDRLHLLEKELKEQELKLNSIYETDLKKVNGLLVKAKKPSIVLLTIEEYLKETEKD